MHDAYHRPAITPSLFYDDPWAALDWLERAFGFERSMVITDQDGELAHAEMRRGDALITLGSAWADFITTVPKAGGRNTQTVRLHLENGIDEHCAQARAAGATILRELTDEFYGDRTYLARDLEGHVWGFGQSVRYVSREDAEKATGFKIDGWP